MVEIFIPMKPVVLNCGHCGCLDWSVLVEPVDKTIKGIYTKAGKLIKLECQRCKFRYNLEDGCVGGSKGAFRANKLSEQKPVTQEQIDNDTGLTS